MTVVKSENHRQGEASAIGADPGTSGELTENNLASSSVSLTKENLPNSPSTAPLQDETYQEVPFESLDRIDRVSSDNKVYNILHLKYRVPSEVALAIAQTITREQLRERLTLFDEARCDVGTYVTLLQFEGEVLRSKLTSAREGASLYEFLCSECGVPPEAARQLTRMIPEEKLRSRINLLGEQRLAVSQHLTLLSFELDELAHQIARMNGSNGKRAGNREPAAVTQSTTQVTEAGEATRPAYTPAKREYWLERMSEEELWEQYQSSRSESLRNEIMNRYTDMVRKLCEIKARKLFPMIAPEDLMGAASVGLMQAVENFEPNRGYKFSTYARYRVVGAIRDELREIDPLGRSMRKRVRVFEYESRRFFSQMGRFPTDEELAKLLDISEEKARKMRRNAALAQTAVSLDTDKAESGSKKTSWADVLEDKGESDESLKYEIEDSIRNILKGLRDREANALRFWISGWPMAKIGELYGVSESRICQIMAEVREQLEHRFPQLRPPSQGPKAITFKLIEDSAVTNHSHLKGGSTVDFVFIEELVLSNGQTEIKPKSHPESPTVPNKASALTDEKERKLSPEICQPHSGKVNFEFMD